MKARAEAEASSRTGSSQRTRYIVTVLVFVLGKLVALPAIGYGLFMVLRDHASFDDSKEDRLMQLVLLLEFAMPSAQLVLVSLNHFKLTAMAGSVARLYIYQYTASIVTITLACWVALTIVYT